jgi:uncharacterized protein YfaS (alpha-2-macroglobulin family)
MTNIFQAGETIRISATITDSAGTATDPATTVISISKPDGTLAVDGSAMTYSGVVGSYYYDYVIGTDTGTYKCQIKATGSGGRITIKPSHFIVEASI